MDIKLNIIIFLIFCFINLYQAGYKQIPYLGGGDFYLDVVGAPFLGVTTFSITVGGVQCTDAVFTINSFTCKIAGFPNQINPYSNMPFVFTINNGVPNTTFSTSQLFKPPTVSQVTQVGTKLVLSGLYFFDPMYMLVTYGSKNLTNCIATNTEFSCEIPDSSSFTSPANLNVYYQNTSTQGSYSASIYGRPNLFIAPYITGLTPNPLPTGGTSATLTGSLFNNNPSNYLYVLQGDGSANTIVPELIGSNEMRIDTIYGISPIKTFRVTVGVGGARNAISNSLVFTYQPPAITQFIQKTSPSNQWTIKGSNFGNITELVSFSLPGFQVISPVYSNEITVELPNTITSGSQTVLSVDGQQAATPLTISLQPKITSTSPIPISGGLVTIIGEYLQDTTIHYVSYDDNQMVISCSTVNTTNYPSVITCASFPSGTGTLELYAIGNQNSLTSLTYNGQFNSPSITDIEPKEFYFFQTTNITITGNDFSDIDLDIKIVGMGCTALEPITSQKIICSIFASSPPSLYSTGDPIWVIVTVNGLQGVNHNILYYKRLCSVDCGEHGTCNYISGQCKCTDNYEGEDCSTPGATPNPTGSNGGTTNNSSGNKNGSSETNLISASVKLKISILISLFSSFLCVFIC